MITNLVIRLKVNIPLQNFRIVNFPGKIYSQILWFGLLIFTLSACQSAKPAAEQPENSNVARSDTQLVLNDAILEQSNNQGNSLWRIKAERTFYSQDRQTAILKKITANLFQEGKLVLQLSAKQGESQNNGASIFLRGNIIATDPRNGATLRSEEIQWYAQEDVLILPQQLTANYPNLEISAAQGKYYPTSQNLELEGNIILTNTEPSLQLKTERLVWLIPQKQVRSDRPLEIVRYQGETITDKLVAARGEVKLAQNSAILQENVELQSLEPQMQIATNSAEWNYQTQIVTTNKPVKIVDRENQLIVIGNQGQINLSSNIAHLWQGTQGIAQKNQAQLYSQELAWNIPTETVEALGNVVYQQNNPAINLTGDRAIGKLTENNVVVSSNNTKGDRVTSIIDNP